MESSKRTVRLSGPEEYWISKDRDDISIDTKISYNILHRKYGYSGRMSDFPVFLKDIFEIPEFEFFDERTWNTAEFLSYLIDLQIEYQKGDKIDMSQLHKDLLKVYSFTGKEKRMFISEHIEEKLWGIFIYLDNPGKEEYIY